ncbi:MAG: translation initiation factor IF-2 [Parcubacteria group bacterium Athens1014_10]|nr:MAG: translation initiation factor IF-2 [Parcubacteria group bacterium Athens1014_10]TSD04699.1 MAG: translation initiation factor IF-2 [Parcubacteria group bacterium Athens0714_12]
MNVTGIIRKLNTTKEEFFQGIKELGFDIGDKAIQIDDRVAKKIIQRWKEIKEKIKEEKTEEVLEEEPSSVKAMGGKKILIPDFITVHDLADKLNLPVTKIISELMKNNIIATINERVDFTTASIIAEDLGLKIEKGEEEEKKEEIDLKELIKEKEGSKLKPRPPVVVVVGHIDHGKTKLLDSIRETNVAGKEAGAITQHIGAYQVEKKGRLITFIDTPGHEAFDAMRARGGKVADIAILVVAADDKVQPQTIESIRIIEKEKLPFIVAINKIDKPEADIERIKKELSELNLIPEDWGGKTICQPISAITKQGIDDLLDLILLVADMEKEKFLANLEREAIGTIIEAHLDKGEGPIATALIHTGTLKISDQILINKIYGKIKALKDWQNHNIKEVPPGMPAKILGLKGMPQVGDILEVIRDKKLLKKRIKELPENYKKETRTMDAKNEKNVLKLILKSDALGSQEAILESLNKIKNAEVEVKIIKYGLGNVTAIDALEADASQGKILGFNIAISAGAEKIAQEKNLDIKTFKIVYDLIDWVNEELTKLLKPEILKITTGKLEVLAIFRKESNYIVIGGRVKEGKIEKKTKVKIIRDNKEIGEGFLAQLQSNKIEVSEVKESQECGMKIEKFNDIQTGDTLEGYKEKIKERKLELEL